MSKFLLKLTIVASYGLGLLALIVSEPAYIPKLNLNEIIYPQIEPYNQDHLQVSDLHKIWFAQYGNPDGIPVIVLHGGQSQLNDMRYFDPKIYNIVLLDQRGFRNSIPNGEIKDNNINNSIDDIEKLRQHLKIDKWLILGHSWGSILAISYGEAYPNNCLGFIFRSIFLGTDAEIKHYSSGIQDTFTEAWHNFVDFLPKVERSNLINSYHKRLSDPNPSIHLPALKSFIIYNFVTSFLCYDPNKLDNVMATDKSRLSFARIFTYYIENRFFLTDNQLLNNLDKIKNLPCILIHGRYDVISKIKTAYDIHRNWPNSELLIIQDAGHSTAEPGIVKALVQSTNKMASKFSRSN